MACCEINVVSRNCTCGVFTTCTTFKYYSEDFNKEDISYIWHYISNSRLMAAKQKMSFQHCVILGKGKSEYGNNGDVAGNAFKKFCLMFKPGVKHIQMVFTTARSREISVSITHRKGYC